VTTQRIEWLDTAKAYGMFLVFFGHVIESVWDAGNPLGLQPFKMVYAFHMPFFFVLSGYLAKTEFPAFTVFLRRQIMSRLVPVVFFCVVLIPGHVILYDPNEQWSMLGFVLGDPFGALLMLARGYPIGNLIVWFLVCLFTVELLHFVVSRFLLTNRRLAIATAITALLGWGVTQRFESFFPGMFNDFWFVREGVLLYAFYQLGLLCRRSGLMREVGHPLWDGVAAVVLLATSMLCATMNPGPWTVFADRPVVLINLAQHGDPLLFGIAAVTGSVGLMLLARATPSTPWLAYVGRNTLVYMGLNGAFFHFANERLAGWLNLPESWAVVMGYGIGCSLVSMTICLPVIWFLNRYVPQLVGGPAVPRPLLPRPC
jgi:acyltransferase